MSLNINLHLSLKKSLVAGIVLVVLALTGLLHSQFSQANPLPASIKSKLTYKVILPAYSGQIVPTSYSFQADKNTLSFMVNNANRQIIFTEQPAPSNLGVGNDVYYQVLGIHPFAQFTTKLGPVALAKFWQANTLTPAGQAAVLSSQGTLLLAHTDQSLTNDQWKNLFDSLTIAR